MTLLPARRDVNSRQIAMATENVDSALTDYKDHNTDKMLGMNEQVNNKFYPQCKSKFWLFNIYDRIIHYCASHSLEIPNAC